MEGRNAELIPKYPRLLEFESKYRNYTPSEPVFKRFVQEIRNHISHFKCKSMLLKIFPIFTTLRKYKLKEDLPNDAIAGLTSGIMMIPQGMAFAALSTLPAIVGLYISFFASITYFWFGTGRQLSWGCVSILSLMIAGILEKFDSNQAGLVISNSSLPASSLIATNASDIINSDIRLGVASGVSIIAGLLLMLMSLLGLSRVSSVMSNSLITGFTVGISFHVATSQLKSLLGITVPRYGGMLSIFQTWFSVLTTIPKTNIPTLLTSILSIIILYIVKKCVNDRFKKWLRIPIPIELLVVIAGTLISKFASFNEVYHVTVVNTIHVGLPSPKIPDLSLVTDYIGDGLVIIIISYAQSLAMAKTFGLKHNYVVDSRQEMFANGACSLVCGLFSGYICGGSVSRSVVQDGAGGRTQIASLFAAGLVFLVIMLLGPFFYHLPMCILSAIILVNLQTMFMKLLEIPKEWRKSKYDCAVWVFACMATIILNPELGLLAGVLFSLFLIALRSMLTPIVESGHIQTSPISVELRSINRYSELTLLKNVRIFKIVTPLYYINADIFTSKVFHKAGINPVKMRKQMKAIQKTVVERKDSDNPEMTIVYDVANSELLLDTSSNLSDLKVLILHAAEVSFVDLMGVQALQFVINEMTSVGVEVLISSVPETVLPILKSTGFLDKNGDRIYLCVEAALASIVTAPSPDTKKTFSTGDSAA